MVTSVRSVRKKKLKGHGEIRGFFLRFIYNAFGEDRH